MHSCCYCKTWKETGSKFRKKEFRGKKTIYSRFCKIVMRDVQGITDPCEHFRPAQWFWCDTDQCWMHVLACLNRDYDCYQKEDVLDAVRGFDLTKEFNMKPRLVIKQPEPPEQPKLKLREKKEKIILIPKKPKLVLKRKTNLVLLRRKK